MDATGWMMVLGVAAVFAGPDVAELVARFFNRRDARQKWGK